MFICTDQVKFLRRLICFKKRKSESMKTAIACNVIPLMVVFILIKLQMESSGQQPDLATSQRLDSMILMDPFQLRIFCELLSEYISQFKPVYISHSLQLNSLAKVFTQEHGMPWNLMQNIDIVFFTSSLVIPILLSQVTRHNIV